MVTFIRKDELEQIARRVWYAPRTKASKVSDNEKHMAFDKLGYANRSTEFPMRSGEWEAAGAFEVSISYPMWNIPGIVRVRKSV